MSADRRETRVAQLEASGQPTSPRGGDNAPVNKEVKDKTDWQIAELYLERRGERSIVGNVYKARVENVVAGLEAAFIDIGFEKNGFLHVDDIVVDGKQVQRRGSGGKGSRITDLLKSGQEIVVQVTKDPLKTKGARLTMQLAIAGRYMVYVPTGEGVGFSRRLDDKERSRLRRETKGLEMVSGGAIIRTAARGAKLKDFEREMLYLHMLHEMLERRAAGVKAPTVVFQEADLSIRVLRDVFTDELDEALIDDPQQYERVKSFLSWTAPELAERVVLYDGKKPLFESYGVEDAIQSILSRRVDLPSGGYLIIDHTEALTVIDVNTGSFTGRGKTRGLEETITQTNLEAADESVRQIRLRDIGGIIVIDFIDMARVSNQNAVLQTLRKAFDEDRTKTNVVEISPLGLVEITRQNVTDGVREILTKICPTCSGESVVLSEETVAINVERKLRDHVADHGTPEAYLVQVHPRVAATLVHGASNQIVELEAETGKLFFFEGGDGLPLDHFEVSFSGPRRKVEEKALRFQAGDEVMVTIVEPHMYEENAAVAKLDGYIIAIEDALGAIGERCLVTITEVGRNTAKAKLIGDPLESGAARKPRSRTERGGGASKTTKIHAETVPNGGDKAETEQVVSE
ncbi:MAG: Rne/Rng family ribonuclease [Thermoleophilaceae bacterium]|nr:Rne/Rng family ribonuclease [Thermoleophilaceae bacterium]